MAIVTQDGLHLIQEKDTIFCDSRELAHQFDKNHYNVIRDIEDSISKFNNSKMSDRISEYFVEADYTSGKKTYKRYKLTFKGFQSIALGFNGEKAFANRIKFIELFEYLLHNIEKDKLTALANSKDAQWLQFRAENKAYRSVLTDAIRKYIADYRIEVEGKMNDGRYYQHYTDLVYKILGVELPKGANPRDTFEPNLLMKLSVLEQRIADKIETKHNQGIHYKKAYNQIKVELTK